MSLSKTIFLLFLCLAVVNLTAEYLDYSLLIYLSKPLLLSSLALGYYQATKDQQQAFDRSIIAALLLSCLGDVLLLFVEQQSQSMLFFAAGLGSFLLAHLAYIYSFWIFPPEKQLQVPLLVKLFFILLAGVLLYFLWEGIPGALKIPVVVYAGTICSMGMAAFGMKQKVNKASARYLLIGALCFILSDSLIAINKFTPGIDLWQARVSIMLTYLLAQWLIVSGILKGRTSLNLTRISSSPNGNQ